MWKDDNEKINEVLFNLNGAIFPEKCPICNVKSLHMYMCRFSKSSRGSGWIWCSSCRSYSHYQYLIPENWENLNAIDSALLGDTPDILDENKTLIDEWVNSFLKQTK